MAITVGSKLPNASLIKQGADGFDTVEAEAYFKGRKVVMFGLPGAFTGTCDTVHLPSFVRTADQFRAKGVDEIICLSVNDPFVMAAWGEKSGAQDAGITMLADPKAELTKALGMAFDAPPVGLYDRSGRYAAVIDDGTVTHAMIDDNAGVCEMSKGEELLDAIS